LKGGVDPSIVGAREALKKAQSMDSLNKHLETRPKTLTELEQKMQSQKERAEPNRST